MLLSIRRLFDADVELTSQPDILVKVNGNDTLGVPTM